MAASALAWIFLLQYKKKTISISFPSCYALSLPAYSSLPLRRVILIPLPNTHLFPSSASR